MAEVSVPTNEDDFILPPGFRFHPTDEEIITHYVLEKVADQSFSARAIGEVDLNKCEPWDLPSKAKMGEKEWYFFCQKDRKYPTGMRTNRATEAGYWKATGKDREIHKGKGILVGMKKTLVFYKGRAPKGKKTNWVMHEFRLEDHSYNFTLPKTSKDEWVVCRVFHKDKGIKRNPIISESLGMIHIEDPMDQHKGNSSNSQIYNQNEMMPSIFPPPNHVLHHLGSSDIGYLHQEQAMVRGLGATNTPSSRGQLKVEQFSNSMVSPSQDTGLSNDWNTEISSYNNDTSAAGPVFDLENLWEY